MMKNEEHVRWEVFRFPKRRPFIQPIAVASVCAVFIGLILVMGIMDMRRMEQALMGFIENRGVSLVSVVERLSQENLDNLVRASKLQEKRPATQQSDEFSPQKYLVSALVEVGKEVDNKWMSKKLTEAFLRKYADEKHVLYIGVIDSRGRLLFQNRPLPPEYLPPQMKGKGRRPEITIDLFTQLGELKKIGFIAMKRRDGKGTIIIALDPEGVRFWGMKVALEKAIRELGGVEMHELAYFLVEDRKGCLLGAAGTLPEKWREGEIRLKEVLSGNLKWDSRKVVYLKREILDMAIPFHLNNMIVGHVRLGLARGAAEAVLAESRKNVIIFISLTIIITLLSMWLLYTNQNRHLEGIVQMERRLEKAERLSALGQLAAGVAHEIRNPLNAISMASQRLMKEYMPAEAGKKEEFQNIAGVIKDEIRRLNGIIEEFLTFSRSRRLTLAPYPVEEVLQKMVSLMEEEAAHCGVKLERAWGDGATVIPMDVDKLRQALLNLIKNAIESIQGSGVVTVSLDKSFREWVLIRISDTGCGLTAEEIDKIFNPEYTTKEKGLGLGLSLAHEIVRGHNGEIRVMSRPGKGTVFEILLPRPKVVNQKNGVNGR
ncbi:MAG TPA: ATP-binding protein [Syntrophales bacterium]|nr:ATP-binding protein [Syntrophales bacterium]HOL58691.1 ATP-binding protein [Syntrophales bacterium]HPO35021.1 ATP-binding protein [Syntrophales bacterium]